MRCRDVEALWDELRGECQASLKQTVHNHLSACPSCQGMYEQYEGVAYRLSSLPLPEASCDLGILLDDRFGLKRPFVRLTQECIGVGKRVEGHV